MPAPFQLLASHPALDFVNTLDNRFSAAGPLELLDDYPALIRFVAEAKLIAARPADLLCRQAAPAKASAALESARQLRESLAELFYGITREGTPSAAALGQLQGYIAEVQRHKVLAWRSRPPLPDDTPRAFWEWSDISSEAAFPVWMLAEQAVELLTSSEIGQVHECRSDTCRWLFLDTSKNHSRRWCDMAICGNRTKARRFQARQK